MANPISIFAVIRLPPCIRRLLFSGGSFGSGGSLVDLAGPHNLLEVCH